MDLIITFIFLIDLIFLYRHASGLKDFIKRNWLDIISVIPFGMAFRLTKLVRTVRLLKLFTRTSKLSKVTKVSKLSKTAQVSKITRGLRVKSQIPRTGKILSKIPKEKRNKGRKK